MISIRNAAAIVAMVAALASQAGCAVGASEAVNDSAAVSSIVAGHTTKQEVVSRFGDPQDRELDPDGGTTWTYQRVKPTALGLIPGLNMMGQSEKETSLQIHFNKKGIVTAVERGTRSL